MTHALNIVWNPSQGIDLGFFMIRYYSLCCSCFWIGLVYNIYDRENESIEKLDSLFIWTVLATLGAVWDMFFGIFPQSFTGNIFTF
jgi:hypothetical protein